MSPGEHQDRSFRVYPLAIALLELLKTESDVEVRVAALRCVLVVPELSKARRK